MTANCGTAARARNAILDFTREYFKQGKWIARLDADDRISNNNALSTLCRYADENNASYVLAGNRLIKNNKLIEKVNFASAKMLEPLFLLNLLHQMSEGIAYNELPSCNLLLSVHTNWRYPDIVSAEDHWLVADLLINHSENGKILENFVYCDYSLNGTATVKNNSNGEHKKIRQKLFNAATSWHEQRNNKDGEWLGYGTEGIVYKVGLNIYKLFYPDVMSEAKIEWFEKTFTSDDFFVPNAKWYKEEKYWLCHYAFFSSKEANMINREQAKEFLLKCLEKKVVCTNIKRSNIRIDDAGRLVYIDIGNSIIPMDIAYFLDSAARLYGISVLKLGDYELLRRKNKMNERQEDVLNRLEGFVEFYKEVLQDYSAPLLKNRLTAFKGETKYVSNQCSLLIKVCAMDHKYITSQVKHIITTLEHPVIFKERILLVDFYEGPFLRQYDEPNIGLVLDQAYQLLEEGNIDRIIIAPNNTEKIRAVNLKWFGLLCKETHSIKGVPVTSQIWGFDQIETKYVLQCDLDILIGRRSLSHDYLSEMICACEGQDILGVAFNIPHHLEEGFREYNACAGDYVPEVRCGLLNLERIKSKLPLPNSMQEGKLCLSWYRSLQDYQRKTGMRTLRGGSPLTYYIHPQNIWKQDALKLSRIRDLISQGRIPSFQYGKWDLEGSQEQWDYEKRSEEIIFLLKGRNTPIEKLHRCFSSLEMQDDQNFGMIVIDDASTINLQV